MPATSLPPPRPKSDPPPRPSEKLDLQGWRSPPALARGLTLVPAIGGTFAFISLLVGNATGALVASGAVAVAGVAAFALLDRRRPDPGFHVAPYHVRGEG